MGKTNICTDLRDLLMFYDQEFLVDNVLFPGHRKDIDITIKRLRSKYVQMVLDRDKPTKKEEARCISRKGLICLNKMEKIEKCPSCGCKVFHVRVTGSWSYDDMNLPLKCIAMNVI